MDDFVTTITTKDVPRGDFLLSIIKEPQNYETTKHHGWIQAMKLKFNFIQKNKVWNLINLPKGKRPINAKWVFKVKPNLDGKLEKLKLVLLLTNMNNVKA
jgi:hypothetical protein